MKQTAVDFAFEKLASQGLLVTKDYKNLVVYREAKEMEKEEIIKAVVWFDETDRRPCEIEKDAEQYYEQTYGGNK